MQVVLRFHTFNLGTCIQAASDQLALINQACLVGTRCTSSKVDDDLMTDTIDIARIGGKACSWREVEASQEGRIRQWQCLGNAYLNQSRVGHPCQCQHSR